MTDKEVRLPHVPGLDGLRGVAILLVLGIHAIPRVLPGGFIGVDLFFVLSGFLITSILLVERRRSGRVDLGRFYVQRALRLLPALSALLLACLVYAYLTEPAPAFRLTLLDTRAAAFYYYNWHVYFNGNQLLTPTMVHLWSLSVEEQFYLVWPVLLILLLTLVPRRSLQAIVIVVCIAAVAVHRALTWPAGGNIWISFRTDLRADTLLWGVLIAIVADAGSIALPRRARLALQAALVPAIAILAAHALMPGIAVNGYLYRIGWNLIGLAGAVLVATTACCPPRPLRTALEWAPIRWLGRVSYGLYLWHYAIFVVWVYYPVARIAAGPAWLRIVVAITASLGMAALSHYYLERPILRWRDRITRRRAGDIGAARPRAVSGTA
jgi:peptidoglycan/LPS O-acetylase OafA/YrhL